jgi:hypothetical protein
MLLGAHPQASQRLGIRLIRLPAAWYVTAGALALAGWQALSAYSARTELAEQHAAAAQETVRRIESMQEVTRYANQSRARDAAHAAGLADAADRLRQRLADHVRRAQAATGSAPAADACVVHAELLRRADERLRQLAAIADERGTAGEACVRAYESLTK